MLGFTVGEVKEERIPMQLCSSFHLLAVAQVFVREFGAQRLERQTHKGTNLCGRAVTSMKIWTSFANWCGYAKGKK